METPSIKVYQLVIALGTVTVLCMGYIYYQHKVHTVEILPEAYSATSTPYQEVPSIEPLNYKG